VWTKFFYPAVDATPLRKEEFGKQRNNWTVAEPLFRGGFEERLAAGTNARLRLRLIDGPFGSGYAHAGAPGVLPLPLY